MSMGPTTSVREGWGSWLLRQAGRAGTAGATLALGPAGAALYLPQMAYDHYTAPIWQKQQLLADAQGFSETTDQTVMDAWVAKASKLYPQEQFQANLIQIQNWANQHSSSTALLALDHFFPHEDGVGTGLLLRLLSLKPTQQVLERIFSHLDTVFTQLEKLNQFNPDFQEPLSKLKTAIDTLKAVIKNKKDPREALENLRTVLKELPPLSLQGISLPDFTAEPATPITPTLLNKNPKPIPPEVTPEEAVELTEQAMGRMCHTVSQTVVLAAFSTFIGKDLKLPELIQGIDRKNEKAFKEKLRKEVRANTSGWRRFLFGSEKFINLMHWVVNSYMKVATGKILPFAREYLTEITPKAELQPIKSTNKALQTILDIYNYIGTKDRRKLNKKGVPTGQALDHVLEHVGKDPAFFSGRTEKELYAAISDLFIDRFGAKFSWGTDFRNWIGAKSKRFPCYIFLPFVGLASWISEKTLNGTVKAILRSSNLVETIAKEAQPKHNRATTIELSVYRSIREALADVHDKLLQTAPATQATTQDQSPIPLSEDMREEFHGLYKRLNDLRRLCGLDNINSLSDYLKERGMLNKGEDLALDQYHSILSEMMVEVYHSLLNKNFLEQMMATTLNSVEGILLDPTQMDEKDLKIQIAKEKELVRDITNKILDISLTQGIDKAFAPKTKEVFKFENELLTSISNTYDKLKSNTDPATKEALSFQFDQQVDALAQQLQLQKENYNASLNATDRDVVLNHLKQIEGIVQILRHKSKALRSEALIRHSLIAHQERAKALLKMSQKVNANTASVTEELRKFYLSISHTLMRLPNPPKFSRDFIREFDTLLNPQSSINLNSFEAEINQIDELMKEEIISSVVDARILSNDTPGMAVAKSKAIDAINYYVDSFLKLTTSPILHSIATKSLITELLDQKKP